MKKRQLAFIMFMTILAAPFAFANTSSLNNGYYSTQHASVSRNAIKATSNALFPVTDITIVNGTDDTIYAVVPDSPINDTLQPGTNDHIRHDSFAGRTHIWLQDIFHHTFFSADVCRLAVVSVRKEFAHYIVNVDEEYCH